LGCRPSYAREAKQGAKIMFFRLRPAFSAAILAVAVASVATSQSPSEPVLAYEGAESGGVAADFSARAEPAAGYPTPAIRPPLQSFPVASSGAGAAGDMIGFSHGDGSGTQTITLVDTRKSWMAVYHVTKSGTIRLVSSRPIDADFSLQLNATSPLPEEIRRIGNR
jgi:hypothetical protein